MRCDDQLDGLAVVVVVVAAVHAEMQSAAERLMKTGASPTKKFLNDQSLMHHITRALRV